MSQARIQMNATILPNGRVLAIGGSANDEDAATASLNADLYNPATNTFSSAGANAYPRLYHSGSLLLPDATVMLVGGNPTRGAYEQHIEIYSPAYLFNANGTPAARPTINGVTPGAFGYGQVFQVADSDPSSIASVVLVRPGAQTHAFDMEQRLVGLSFTAGSGVLNVTAPPNGNIAPPGYYMLFVLNAAGVPSVARFVQLSASISNQPPDGDHQQPRDQRHGRPRGARVLLRERKRSGRNDQRVCLDLPRWHALVELGRDAGQRRLLDAGHLHGLAHGDRQRRPQERARDAHDYRRGLFAIGHADVANRPAGSEHDLHRDGDRGNRLHGNGQLQRDRPAVRRHRVVQPRIRDSVGHVHAHGRDDDGDADGQPSADDSRHERAAHAHVQRHARRHCQQSGSDGEHHQSRDQRHGESGRRRPILRERNRSKWDHQHVCVDLPRRHARVCCGRRSGQCRLLDAGQLYGVAYGHGQRRTVEPECDAHHNRVGLLAVGHANVANRPAGGEHDLHRDGDRSNGLHGNGGLQRDGLPAGATASFSPTAVTPSGTSTLTVATTTATPPGSYPLTIRGTSGPRVRTVNVTLVVNGSAATFSITASPTSRTISRGGVTTYTVTVPGGQGFVGTIALSVSGVPNHTNAEFTPTSIVNSGTSTLTVDTRRKVARGTHTLVIRGTSGSTVRTVNVTLIVQ